MARATRQQRNEVSANHVTVQIKPNTPEMDSYLQLGYQFNLEHAKTVIAERKANPASWPLDHVEKCQAFIEAYSASPQVVATRPAWQIDGRPVR